MSEQPVRDEAEAVDNLNVNQVIDNLGGTLGDQMKESMKQQMKSSGQYTLISTLVNILPLSHYRKNRMRHAIQRKINGEDVGLLEIVLGERFGIGFIIRLVIGIIGAIIGLILISRVGIPG